MRAAVSSCRNVLRGLRVGRIPPGSLRVTGCTNFFQNAERRSLLQQQSFTTSQRRTAEEVDINQQPPIWKRIQENPAIMDAISNFVEVAKKEGLDLSNPNPSLATMFKIASNPRIKDAMNQIRDRMEAAGIEITKQDAFNIMNAIKTPKP
ncbi:hypothetical protein CPB86DRAFT_782627 [Serendipita vermifera]|nr:hypothetical protein CPB86DRAFT_782627 [Serendipita vermifera]